MWPTSGQGYYLTFQSGGYLYTHLSAVLASSELSVSFWFRTTSWGGGHVFKYQGASSLAVDTVLGPESELILAVNSFNLTLPHGLNDNTWHHLVLICSTQADFRIYVDFAAITYQDLQLTEALNATEMYIGPMDNPTDLDEFIFWSRTIGLGEVYDAHDASKKWNCYCANEEARLECAHPGEDARFESSICSLSCTDGYTCEGYTCGRPGTLCNSSAIITSQTECETAAGILGFNTDNMWIGGAGTVPYGCSNSHNLHLNSASYGGANGNSSPICRANENEAWMA